MTEKGDSTTVVEEAEARAERLGRCGFCVGIRPGPSGSPPPPIKTENAGQCPCCWQYALELYDGSCVGKHVGYGTQAGGGIAVGPA